MGLSEFHDTLAMIILHVGGDIGDGHCRGEISLIRHRGQPFSYFFSLIRLFSFFFLDTGLHYAIMTSGTVLDTVTVRHFVR